MNVLFISPTIPYPATDGGRIRVLNLLKELTSRVRVRLLAPRTRATDDAGVAYLRGLGIATLLAERAPTIPRVTARALIRAATYREPLTVAKYYFPAITEMIRESVFSDRPDVVHLEMLHTAPYLSALPPPTIPTLLSLQNVDSAVWSRLVRRTGSPMRRILYGIQSRQFHRYEVVTARRVHMATCVSEQDRRLLQESCPDLDIAVVPNGVDVRSYQPMPEKEQPNAVVYTGSMDWYPNEDAVMYFIEQIWPAVRASVPDAHFYVVGQNPGRRLQQLNSRDDVTVTGHVDDVRGYIARGAVYVVPLRVGGGTRLKILEALAMQRAVVSTSIGCEGLSVRHSDNIIVCDEPDTFARAVLRLFRDAAQRQGIGAAGRRLVEEEYDWRQIGAAQQAVYEELAASR